MTSSWLMTKINEKKHSQQTKNKILLQFLGPAVTFEDRWMSKVAGQEKKMSFIIH